MSMDARGQLGKSLVFLGWKGLKTVRSFVIPANPNTDAQAAQRGNMTDAVAAFHAAAYNDLDRAALNVLASIQAKVMSGFNAFCKLFIYHTIEENAIVIPSLLVVESNTGGEIEFKIEATGTLAGKARYGSSPTVMGETIDLTKALGGDPYTGTLTGLTPGSYVYMQLYTEVAESFIMSGIYKILVLA
jgi:hypothetical protein